MKKIKYILIYVKRLFMEIHQQQIKSVQLWKRKFGNGEIMMF